MANPITYNGYQTLGGGDAMSRFTIRGQVYEYHMSKSDADTVHWLKSKSVGKALNVAKKRAYKTVKASNERFLNIAYELGQRTSKQTYNEIAYGDDGDLMERVVDDNWGNVFFEEGRDYPNKPFPKKTVGWRYGNPPKVRSWNAREDVAERGVSVMQVKGGKKLRGLYEIANGFKPVVFVEGYLLHSTGGDDESLLADAKVAREPGGSWDYPRENTASIDKDFVIAEIEGSLKLAKASDWESAHYEAVRKYEKEINDWLDHIIGDGQKVHKAIMKEVEKQAPGYGLDPSQATFPVDAVEKVIKKKWGSDKALPILVAMIARQDYIW